jgi:hypothetical protein
MAAIFLALAISESRRDTRLANFYWKSVIIVIMFVLAIVGRLLGRWRP